MGERNVLANLTFTETHENHFASPVEPELRSIKTKETMQEDIRSQHLRVVKISHAAPWVGAGLSG